MPDPSLGVLLFIPTRYLDQRILGAVVDAGFPITMAQAKLLQRVGPDGTRLSTLAEAAEVTKQSAGYLVDQLEAAGYAERVPDPSDARARLVRLTAHARGAIEVARLEERRIEDEWVAHLGVDDVETMRRILLRLRTITDPYL